MERGIFVPMMIPAFPDNPCGGGATGTVTSVGITAPAIFAVTNSPVTTAGVIDLALVTQTANRVFAGPSTGAPAAPTFRTLVAADLGTGTPTVNTVLRGDMTWGDATSVVGWTPSLNTSSPNNTINASRLLVNSTSVNGDAVIQPKGTGALLGSLPDGTATGGNKRGQYAVDLQLVRVSATQVASGDYSCLLGGSANQATALYSATLSGNNNVSGGQYSVIAGGYNHSLTSVASFIGGGLANQVSANYSSVSGGSGNSCLAIYSCISGGYANVVSGTYGSVGGGSGNVADGTWSHVGGGFNNTALGDYSSVVGGLQARARRYGEVAQSSGSFVTAGDCQRENVILRRVTTNATPTVLTLDGTSTVSSTTQIALQDNASYAFRGIVTARRQDALNESAMWLFSGGIDRNSGTTSLVGCPQITTIGDDSAGAWSITVDADDTNDVLTITVTGQTGKTIYWGCSVELMAVKTN